MEYPYPSGSLAPALTATTGVVITPEVNKGCLLAAATTYYFTGDARAALITSFGIKWDAAIIITALTIEDTNCEDGIVSSFDATNGNGFVTETPTAFPVSPAGSGAVATGNTLSTAGGTAGAAIAHLANLGSIRQRVKVVVGATGGYLVVCPHGKA